MKRVCLVLATTVLVQGLPGFTKQSEAATAVNTHATSALTWLNKQLDPPGVQVSLNAYPSDYVGLVEGTVQMASLPANTPVQSNPNIKTTAYPNNYSGIVKGTFTGITDWNAYSVYVFDHTDIGYKKTTATLNANGTWSAGSVTFNGKPVIALVKGGTQIVGFANDPAQSLSDYEVWIYAKTDTAYLQAKAPIRSDGTFETKSIPIFTGGDLLGYTIPDTQGLKEARVIKKSESKVVGTTEKPKLNLIRSFYVPLDDQINTTAGIGNRSWIYDDALGVISYGLAGDKPRASTILGTLANLQNADGSLYFSYNIVTGEMDDKKRSGAIAWVGYAATQYEKKFNDTTYRTFAVRIADYLLTLQDATTGSVKGGPDVPWFSTEHNVDSYFFLRDLGKLTGDVKYVNAADLVKNALLQSHWNVTQQRFNQGVNDTVGALDANSWGSIFLEAIGRHDLAVSATAYVNNFKVNNASMALNTDPNAYNNTYQTTKLVSGYKPYLVDNGDFVNAPNIVWTEGTWGVINLFLRQGTNAQSLIQSMYDLQDADVAGGLVYTNTGAASYDFHVWPSVAATAWQYITLTSPTSIWEP
ncbi:hypothetical protein [Paenibacillus glacialis]|uniref:hypothetical protein n=1 Tax=Paenibacillus glacialis TaxID=494026 RepID=UPI001B80366D|nr:hypothetical protein [Paenibacillus glacialis]